MSLGKKLRFAFTKKITGAWTTRNIEGYVKSDYLIFFQSSVMLHHLPRRRKTKVRVGS